MAGHVHEFADSDISRLKFVAPGPSAVKDIDTVPDFCTPVSRTLPATTPVKVAPLKLLLE